MSKAVGGLVKHSHLNGNSPMYTQVDQFELKLSSDTIQPMMSLPLHILSICIFFVAH